jgi:chromosome partitioning protein
VTDPEELRTRAASIFERLRQGGGRTEAADSEIGTSSDDSSHGSQPTPPAERPADSPVEGTDAPSATSPADPARELRSGSQPPMAATTIEGEESSGPDVKTETTGGISPPPDSSTAPAPAIDTPVPAGVAATRVPDLPDLSDLAARLTTPGGKARSGGLGGAESNSAAGLPQDLPILGGPIESPRPPGWRGERPLPRILAIANQKGGVGKTTTAVNLGAALAELGYRVLVIDLDPQGNATTGLGINARNLDTSIYDVLLHDVAIEDCIEPTSLRNLFVVPATIDLAGAEIELVPVFSRELRLRRAVERIKDDFDFTLIDCPPSLGLLTVNGLAAATEVVVPIQCEYYALEGLGQLLRNVNLVSSNLNPHLEVTTIVLTMYDARTRLAEQVVADVRSHFGDRVCRSVVPRTVRLSEAPSFGQPIIVFDSSSRGAIAYRELAKEVSGGAPQRIG